VIKLGWGTTIGGSTTVGHTKGGDAGRHYMEIGGGSTDGDFGQCLHLK
jgi:hypothetical protein